MMTVEMFENQTHNRLIQQATHPRWGYVRGTLRKQAAVTNPTEYRRILGGSRHVFINLMSYIYLYVLKTTYR